MTQEQTTLACVLLVDDNVTFLYALSEALRLRLPQVNFVTCNSAFDALHQIDNTDYDAIVSDIKMPYMDGLDLLAAVRARRPETPTLLITGYEEYQLVVQALRGGAYDIIQKPIDWYYFMLSLTSAIHTRQVSSLRASAAMPESPLNNPTLLAHIKVLIVDDDLDGREMQSTALKHCGAEVLAVGSVEEAKKVFTQFGPDILVSDIRMPLEDGYSLLRKVRRLPAQLGGRIPAVAVTAYADEEQRAQALRAGYQLQIAKPVDPAILALAVARLTGQLC